MKIRHRVPVFDVEVVVDLEYEAQVERDTARLERRYAEQVKRVEAAERRAQRIAEGPRVGSLATRKRLVEEAWILADLRREELLAIQRLMTSVSASGQHRGHGVKARLPAMRQANPW